jgi:phage tail sheath gpL-like
MAIETGVDPSLATPQTSHRFTYLRGGGQLVPLAQKVSIIGAMKATGTGVAGTVYPIYSPEQADKLFAPQSEAALGVRQAFRTQRVLGRGPQIVAIGVTPPDAVGDAAATFTITISGPATEAGVWRFQAIGRTYLIGIALGNTATQIGDALVDVVSRDYANLPFTLANVAGVVTATYAHKGENGNAMKFGSANTPAGVGVVIAAGVAGVGVLDLDAAYAALEATDIDGFAPSSFSAAAIADALDHVTAMWAPAEKRWRWGFVADTTSLASGTALATAANDRALVVPNMEDCPNLPLEVAVTIAVAAFSRSRPNATYNGLELPLFPPPIASAYNGAETEAGIQAGLTILRPVERGRVVVSDRVRIVRLVTTKTTDAEGNPFRQCRDLGVPRTGAALARQLDLAYAAKFGSDANPEGVLMDDGADDRVRDLVAVIWHDAAAARWIKNVDADLAELIVEADAQNENRFDVQTAQTVIIGLMQVAYSHNVKVGG